MCWGSLLFLPFSEDLDSPQRRSSTCCWDCGFTKEVRGLIQSWNPSPPVMATLSASPRRPRRSSTAD
ncbi:hypothetical protein BRADI_5g16315v3 [Brachypodium distachyon]|uniref:Uncharacterized protein n=1 Tax=Brachypodium distachyon TaxID=15368 RepID=A0A2K2CHM7_BRADI|nr:hypothetical protein BRADI_5g16315v3 [Brachypodium distachyon]